MLTTKTKKAVCLTLLMSFTASVSAEGWLDWLKNQLTPTKVATVSLAGAGLFYHYWFKRRTTQNITINGQRIDVRALGLQLSNYENINARIEPGNYQTLLDHDYNTFNRVVIDENSGENLFGFTPGYELDNNLTENKGVSLVYNKRIGQMHLPWNWLGCLCCSNSGALYASNANPLATALYAAVNENELKSAYAERLHQEWLRKKETVQNPATDIRTRADLENAMEILVQKHSRVMGAD